MCVFRRVPYVGNACHMSQESPLWMMCDWERYKMVTYVTPTFFGFVIMCPSWMSIIQIFDNFQLYVQRYLSFGLVTMSYSWFGNDFVWFNKPYVSPYYLYIVRDHAPGPSYGCWAKSMWIGGVVLLPLKMEVWLIIFSPLD